MISRYQTTITLLAGAIVLASCSTASWYQGAKASGEAHCRTLPQGEYQECMRSYDKTYNEYKKQREEAIQK
jgi:hypothetical protein